MKAKEAFTSYLVVFLLSSAIFYVIIYFWKRRWLYYYAAKMNGPRALPIIGSFSLFMYREKALETFLKLAEKFQPIAKCWAGPTLLIMITRPKDLEFLLKKNLEKVFPYYLAAKVGTGIFSSPVEQWKGHRRLMNRTFTQNILNSYLEQIIARSNILEKELRLQCNTQFDIFPDLLRCTFHTIYDSLMGEDSSDLNQKTKYMQWISRSLNIVSKRVSALYYFEIPWILSGNARELDDVYKNIQNYIKNMIEKKKSSKNYENNYLSSLIEMTEGEWESQELIDETQIMFTAGTDTTSTTEAFCLIMIGMHQNVQEKLNQEMISIFGKSNRDPVLEDLVQMSYLDRVIKETLRLFPAVPVMFRYVHEDVVLDDCVIPKGSNLGIPTIFIHRNPEYWPDPLKFDPDRFLPEEVAKRPRYAYLPFSIPSRNCIGSKFAEMKMKVTLSKILKHYDVHSTQYNSIESITLLFNFVLASRDGFGVTLVPK